MDIKKFSVGLLLMILLMSVTVFAQTYWSEAAPKMICGILCNAAKLILFVVVFVVVSMIVIYGAKWATSADDPESRTQAKNAVIYVIIAFLSIILAMYVVSWLGSIARVGNPNLYNPVDLLYKDCSTICSDVGAF